MARWTGPRGVARIAARRGTVGSGITGADNRNAGLTQTGQVTGSGAIDRSGNSFVGSSSDTAGSLRSQSAANGGINSLGGGLGGTFGLGTNLGAGLSFGSNLIGGGGYGGLGGIGGFGGGTGFGAGGRNAQTTQRNGGSTQLPIRAPIRIGFTYATVSSAVVSSRFTRRLSNLPGIQLTSPVQVTMEGQTAVLQGTVASENDRDLIGRLAVLEPGIAEVRNELTVVPPTGP